MSLDLPSPTRSALRELRLNLAAVNDAQLLKVTALIDQMVERGAMDDLIVPLRGRFGQVRPPRPLRFTRLLFLPIDAMIVPPRRYRAGMPTVPRTALSPLASVVRDGLGPRAAEIDLLIAGCFITDVETIQRAGEVLWREAAVILAQAKPSAAWATTGLPTVLYTTLARSIAVVLKQADELQRMVMESAAGLPIDIAMVDSFLTRAAPAGPEPWGLVLAALLGRLPAPDAVLRQASAWMARHGDPALRVAIEQVLDSQLMSLEADDTMTADMLAADLATAGAEVHRVVALLDGLVCDPLSAGRLARVQAIRHQLDVSCRTRFAEGLTEEFIAPLHALLLAPEPDAPRRLEAAARHLRSLETEGRRLGGAPTYDALLNQTALAVREAAPGVGLTLAETVRLVEILAGPEAALRLLG